MTKRQPPGRYRGYRNAGIRLNEDVLPDVVAHRTQSGMAILYAVHAFDKAHLAMLGEQRLIPLPAAAAMLQTLRDTEADGIEKARRESGGGMHSAEYLLIQRLGEDVGGHIALARSSGDLGATSMRIVQRDQLLAVMDELNRVRAALLDVAERHVGSVMPGYQQGQHAQPTTLGHYLAAWAAALERDCQRALDLYRRTNLSPSGSAIMTGSDFAVDRHRTAELLGFDGPTTNTFDAIMSHDLLVEGFAFLAILNGDLGRLADDLMLWATSEFGFVDIPDRFCGTSSILAQAKNPYAPQYVKGLAAASVGALVTSFLTEKGPTGSAVLDRQYAYDDLWNIFRDTVRDLRWFVELLPELHWNTGRMQAHAGAHWAQATDIAGALVREKGLPWRTAHQIVGILVRLASERGLKPSDTTVELLDEAALDYIGEPVGLSQEALDAALDPAHFVQARTLFGGPAADQVAERIADFRRVLDEHEAARVAAAAKVEAASPALEAAIDAVIESAEAPEEAVVEEAAPAAAEAAARRVSRRALVVGAGVGGLATAAALQRAGIDVDVFEATGAGSAGGAVLGPTALNWLGMTAPTVEWEEFWTPAGKSLARLPVGQVASGMHLVEAADVRAALLQSLGGAVHLGRVCVGMDEDVTGVTLRFADGSEERGAVAIGADGVDSVVRKAIGGQEPERSRYLAWHGTAPSASVPVGVVRIYLGRGATFLAAGVEGGRVVWTGVKAVDEDHGPGSAGVKRDVLDHFRGWKDPVQALLERTPEDAIAREAARTHSGGRWSSARLSVVGTAAHAPAAGLGHTLRSAIADAMALADQLASTDALADQAGIAEAFAAYQRLRSGDTSQAAAEARSREDMFLWSGRAKTLARDTAIRLTSERTWRKRLHELYAADSEG